MNEGLVLIVSTKVDLATDAVVERLVSRGVSCDRLNTEDFPFEDTLTCYPSNGKGHRPWLAHNGKALPNPASIWYRRLRTPAPPAGMDEGVATFCRQEARAALLGAMIGRDARWMSHPAAIWQAEFKPWQLQLAESLGLPTPRTVITNDPRAIRDAFDEFGSMIVKPVRSGYVVSEGVGCAIYTSRLLAEHLEDLESARWAPSIYQDLIPKRYDVRVTIVGGRCFAAAIDSPSDPAAVIDWRHTENPDLPHYRINLPARLEESLHRLMRSLDLAFGAIDLVQTPDGEYVFLEINPSGQWLWLDDKLDLGISDAVADWLRGDHRL